MSFYCLGKKFYRKSVHSVQSPSNQGFFGSQLGSESVHVFLKLGSC